MDDKYDLVGFFLSKDGLLRSGIIGLLEGTPLEESAGSLSFAIGYKLLSRNGKKSVNDRKFSNIRWSDLCINHNLATRFKVSHFVIL